MNKANICPCVLESIPSGVEALCEQIQGLGENLDNLPSCIPSRHDRATDLFTSKHHIYEQILRCRLLTHPLELTMDVQEEHPTVVLLQEGYMKDHWGLILRFHNLSR